MSSEFKAYKDRRAFAEGWPYYQLDADGEHPHTKPIVFKEDPDDLMTVKQSEWDRINLMEARALRDAIDR